MATYKHGFTRIKTDKNGYNNKLLEAELSYKIRGCFYKVFNQYGPGLKEIVYHKALAEELQNQGLNFVSNPRINIFSQETGKTLGTYIPDFIVEDKIIIEIKALNRLTFLEKNQLMSYLRASLYEIAFLVNFGASKLEINRLILTNDRKPFIRVNPSSIRENPCKIRVNPSSIRVHPCFTLMELLIIIALLALVAIAAFVLLNPKKQLEKVWDGKRKHELSQLKKVLEDWYNDKNCYPRPEEICYDSPTANNTCHICGNHQNSPKLTPYLSSLPCDPQHPTKEYLYQVDNPTCPKWYRIYADLSSSDYTTNDPQTEEVGCFFQGCGPGPNYGYDYGLSSPNVDLERSSSFAYCAISGCNICGTYLECLNIWQNRPDLFCRQKRIIAPASYCGQQNCPCQP